MSDDKQSIDNLDSNQENQTNETRRKLTKAGIASVPVMLTLSSRPVWARSCSVSGQMSGNLSDANEEPCGGQGCTPGFWKTHSFSHWSPQFPPDELFMTVFGVDAFPGLSLYEVINLRCADLNDGPILDMVGLPGSCFFMAPPPVAIQERQVRQAIIQLGFHAVAALQNAATEVSYDLTVMQVTDMFAAAYSSCSKASIEDLKDILDTYNNQGCPFGGGAANPCN